MRLLVLTQKVDRHDANLGFFHAWLEKLAEGVETLTVICLEKGECQLPANVTIVSLGKEQKTERYTLNAIGYIYRFYCYLFQYRKKYDAVFVHMNPEYAILGGLFWRLSNKKVLLWYTHKAVNLRLRIAEKFVDTVFTVSKESFRLPSKKVKVVGHGIPVDAILVRKESESDTVQLLSVGRLSPVKDIETIILACRTVKQPFHLTVIGDAITPADVSYKQSLVQLVHQLGLEKRVRFLGGMTHDLLSEEYAKYQIFIHTSKTGSIDKVVLEALASGLQVITSSEAFQSFGDLVHHFKPNNPTDLAQCIEKIVTSGILRRPNNNGREFVKSHHDLGHLVRRIITELKT